MYIVRICGSLRVFFLTAAIEHAVRNRWLQQSSTCPDCRFLIRESEDEGEGEGEEQDETAAAQQAT